MDNLKDAPFPTEDVMKLSDAYLEKTDTPMLELKVKVININLPANHKLLKLTIEDCEKEGIMVDFVRKHGSEAVNMLFTQWNLEDALEVRYEEGHEDGFKDGTEKGEISKVIQQVCRKLLKDKMPEEIAEALEEELAVVEKICRAVEECGNTTDLERIYEIYQKLS